MNWNQLASKEQIDKTIAALKQNGITAELVESGEQAKEKLTQLMPEGAEVMDMSSETLQTIGVADLIRESGQYNSVHKELLGMNRETQDREMQRLGAAPEYAVGSVHAVTEDGWVYIASNTGSQLPAYAYGAGKIIWVVGAQKIVKDKEQALQRIYNYVLPLESKRMQKLYGMNSNVSKLLEISKEIKPGRIHIIFVNEKLGF